MAEEKKTTLEEAASRYAFKPVCDYASYDSDLREAFIAGAKWQKEQQNEIMKADTLEELIEYLSKRFDVSYAKLARIVVKTAKWQKEQDEREASKDLEDEIHSFWNRCSEFQPPFATLEVKENGFAVIARHFANWQKQQMMKEAVEGELTWQEIGLITTIHTLMLHDPAWAMQLMDKDGESYYTEILRRYNLIQEKK